MIMTTCKGQLWVAPMKSYEITQLPSAQRSSSLDNSSKESLPGDSSSAGVLRLPLDIVQLTGTQGSGRKEIERLFGGPSSSSALRVPAYRCIVQGLPNPPSPDRRSCGAKEIQRSLSGDSSPRRVLRIPSWPKVRELSDSEDQSTNEYVSIAELVKEKKNEILRQERIPLKDPILEKACSAYLQLPARNKKGFGRNCWHSLWEAVCRVLPISCLTGSSGHEAEILEDCHNLDNCDGLLEPLLPINRYWEV